MEYAFLILTTMLIIYAIMSLFKSREIGTEIIQKCRSYLKRAHAEEKDDLEFKFVKRFAKNRYKIKYNLEEKDREILVAVKDNSLKEIAKIKELEDDIDLNAITYTHRKFEKRKRVKKFYKVYPTGAPSYYCVETVKGKRFYYTKLGQNIIPNF